jgi:chaperonin GroES
MATFKPILDRVLLKPVKAQEKSSPSGIYIPEVAREAPPEAVVVAAGPGVMIKGKFHPTHLKPGDLVVYARTAGTPVKIEDEDHLVVREEEIFAVIKKASP